MSFEIYSVSLPDTLKKLVDEKLKITGDSFSGLVSKLLQRHLGIIIQKVHISVPFEYDKKEEKK